MKNKVVVFTQNNARILINPPDLTKFEGKPNTFINPDLSLVTGVEPHFWKLLQSNQPIDLNSAHRLRKELDDLLVISEKQNLESEHSLFYRALREELQNQIEGSEKAFDLLSKLINKANGIDRDSITTQLYDRLISHSKNPGVQKQNLIFKHMITQWEMGSIIPMDDDERRIRSKDLHRRGPINTLYQAPAKRWWASKWPIYASALIVLIIAAIKLIR